MRWIVGTCLGTQIFGGIAGFALLCWGLVAVHAGVLRQDPVLEFVFWGSVPAIFLAVQAWRNRRWALVGSLAMSAAMFASQVLTYRKEWSDLYNDAFLAQVVCLTLNGLHGVGLAVGLYANRASRQRIASK